MGRVRRVAVVALLGLSVVAVVAVPGGASVAEKKKLTACTVLTVDQMQGVVGAPVTGPSTGSRVGDCGFDVGDGLLEPGGGLIVIQLYKGLLAKNIWSATKADGEKVGKVVWDESAGIAFAKGKKGRVVGISVSITDTQDSEHRDEAVELVNLALARL